MTTRSIRQRAASTTPKTASEGATRRLTLDELVYIISMGVALNTKVAGVDIPSIVIYGIAAFWIAVALFRTVLGEPILNRGLKPLGIRFAAPKVLMLVYSYALVGLGLATAGDGLGGLNQIISVALPISTVYLYGSRSIDLVFWSCLVSFLFVVPYTCIVEGIGSIAAPFLSVFDPTIINPFETHQFTFTAGFLFVYYSLINKEAGHGWKSIASFAMCFMGFKRIVLLALLLVVAVRALRIPMSKKSGMTLYNTLLAAMAIACFVFIVLLYSGFVEGWMKGHSINVMGRNYYWQTAVSNSFFGPAYLGAGTNSLTHLLTGQYAYLHVGGVHCDILKYYFEIGFFGFIAWLIYFLVYLPNWLKRSCGTQTFEAYSLTVLFMFVLFFTDNVDIYYGSQLLFAAIPMVVWFESRDAEKEMEN